MAILLAPPPSAKRAPNRDRSNTTVSLSWPVYDRLDAIATASGLSLAATIDALVSLAENQE